MKKYIHIVLEILFYSVVAVIPALYAGFLWEFISNYFWFTQQSQHSGDDGNILLYAMIIYIILIIVIILWQLKKHKKTS